MREDRELRTGVATALGAYVVWGLLTIYWKQLTGLDAFELIGLRITMSVVLLAAALTFTRRWDPVVAVLRQRALLGRLVIAALALTANWTTYVWAVTHHNVVETALGYFTAPLCVVAVGVMVLGERLRRAQVVALTMAVAAVLVLAVGYGKVPWFALILAGSWSIYGYLKKLVPLAPLESLAAETLVVMPLALVLIGAREGTDHAVSHSVTAGEVALVAFAGVITAVPLLMFAAAAHRVPLTTLGPLQYAVPVINFLLGVAVYHEPMPPSRLAGFALVWVALVVFTADSVRALRSGSASPRARAGGTDQQLTVA